MKLEDQYHTLVESLRLLASPRETQIEALPEYVDVPFEVLDNFFNAFLLVPQLIEGGFLSQQATAELIRCSIQVNFAFGNEEMKSLESLRTYNGWDKLRTIAETALKSMNEKSGKPNLDFLTYKEGK